MMKIVVMDIYLLHKSFAILKPNTWALEAFQFEFSSVVTVVSALLDLARYELILFHFSQDNAVIYKFLTLDSFPSSCQSSLIDIKPQTLLT